MLLKGAYCVGEHFVDPQCYDEMVVLISIYTAKYSDSMPECIFRLIITRWIGGNRKL